MTVDKNATKKKEKKICFIFDKRYDARYNITSRGTNRDWSWCNRGQQYLWDERRHIHNVFGIIDLEIPYFYFVNVNTIDKNGVK
jgi:hypothetical protein